MDKDGNIWELWHEHAENESEDECVDETSGNDYYLHLTNFLILIITINSSIITVISISLIVTIMPTTCTVSGAC